MGSETSNSLAIREKMTAVWPELIQELIEDPEFEEIPEAAERIDVVLKRNATNGKNTRSLAFITFYNSLAKDISPEDERLSYLIGLAIEIGHAAVIIADDIMDDAQTRRGEICWHREDSIGLSAVNDAFLLESLTFFIFYKYFMGKEYFRELVALTHDIILKTLMGSSLEIEISLLPNLDGRTAEVHRKMTDHKTSYYTFFYPYATALMMAGIEDENILRRVEKISLEMGYLYQVQDDYLDCYGNPALTGKIGSDIIENKCTWLLVTALELASESQKETLKTGFESKTQAGKDMVVNIYEDLNVNDRFKEFEEKCYRHIEALIADLPVGIPQEPFLTLLGTLHKRYK